MAIQFEFLTAGRILFGVGSKERLPQLAAAYGRRALVIHGVGIAEAAPILEQLKIHRIEYGLYAVHGEPTVSMIKTALQRARTFNPDLLIGLGGGSAIDAAKAIAALYTNPGAPLDYLEVIGKGRPLEQKPLPLIAVPTTAGTGSEATKNAVLRSEEHGVKVSLRHDWLLPVAAVVDPALTLTLPATVTAYTGMDALTQLIEPMVSLRANPFIDAICRAGLNGAMDALRRAVADGADFEAREKMSFAALCGGIALANAGLGAVHGLAGVIGGLFDAPHGAVCARLLPLVMEANLHALKERAPDSPALAKYREIAVLLTSNPNAAAEDGCTAVNKLCGDLDIPKLSTFGMQIEQIPSVVAQAQKASSMKTNPIVLTEQELADILIRAL
ncbi:MAG: iron-containing alcohol dehydrogenase [candidate division KSB1 bacterium]|nr:iron-containing alcohol dehydrogenase [candidate division KSB1 bacterium]